MFVGVGRVRSQNKMNNFKHNINEGGELIYENVRK